jgi:hypothetical protein
MNRSICAVFFGVLLAVGCGVASDAEPDGVLEAEPDGVFEEGALGGTCPGAVGPNCGLCVNSATTAGWVRCNVSVGAMMHDTCCGDSPNGVACGGTEKAMCTPPANSDYAGKPYRCCQAEWDHAKNDTLGLTDRQWSLGFLKADRARPGWRAAFTAVINGDVSSRPGPDARLAPSGTRIYYADGQLGWCANGVRKYDGYDAICN